MSGAQIAIVGLGIAAYALMRSRNTTSTKQDAEAEVQMQEKHRHRRHHRKHEPKVMEGNNHDPGPTKEEKDNVNNLLQLQPQQQMADQHELQHDCHMKWRSMYHGTNSKIKKIHDKAVQDLEDLKSGPCSAIEYWMPES